MPVSPIRLLPQIMSDLDLPPEMEPSVRRLIKEYLSSNFPTGKDPRGIAGGAVYFACLDTKYRKTQEEVAKASKITEATLRKRYHEISTLNQ
ncbi:MAG: hypothetical protein GF370_02445 [Candidatus Nealsonbacteria bacterium]|nr:hypothetical protein [Candidatus Nealsonbacteria bacterium]